ncbi:MAG: translation initiation factor IF-6 [Thermoplasmata archaeon]
MPVARGLLGGSPYLGVYLRTTDRWTLLPPSAPVSLEREAARVLGTRTLRLTVQDNEVLGAMVAMNGRGAVVGSGIDPAEERVLSDAIAVHPVASRLNAMGNNVLANDTGALVHPEFSDAAVARIGEALGVPAQRGTVAGLGTVGMAAAATNRGVVVHPRATEAEIRAIESVLGVPVHRSTANFGVPIVGACLVANARGLLVGLPTTPVEIVHLEEGFSVYDGPA